MYKVKSRFWIEAEEGTFLGEGRVRLLQAVQDTGSITSAAKSLDISYRKAWKMIDIMNKQSKTPLVIRQTGGKRGGGTVVTDEGVIVIQKYLDFKHKCNTFINKTFEESDF